MKSDPTARSLHTQGLRTLSLGLVLLVLMMAVWVPVIAGPTYRGVFQAERTPAGVMGVAGADWLVRPERIEEERPDEMLAALEIAPGSVVVDIGAGVGYHTWRLAQIVGPSGRVIAEDIQPAMLELLRGNIEERDLENVEIVLGTPTDPRLPAGVVDLVLMVDVYHEFSDYRAMLRAIRASLKPDGRVVLVEYRQEDPTVPILPLHKMSEEGVRSELEPMGFGFVENIDFLPWQHVLVFRKTD
jgi:precorrin-6B methylase 2